MLFSYSSSHFLTPFHSPPFPILLFVLFPPSVSFFLILLLLHLLSFLHPSLLPPFVVSSPSFHLILFHFHSLPPPVSLVSSPPTISFSFLLPLFLPLPRLLFFIFSFRSLRFLFHFFSFSLSFTASYFPYHLF